MSTQYKLSESQLDILVLLKEIVDNNILTIEEIEGEEKTLIEKLCNEAIDSYAMGCDEVESIVNQLQSFGYLNKDVDLTVDGRQYIEVGYQPEVSVNNITVNNIKQQTNIDTKKYVERKAPLFEMGSAVNVNGVSIEGKGIEAGIKVKEVAEKVKSKLPL